MHKGRIAFPIVFLLSIVLVAFSASAQEKRFTVPVGDSPALGPVDAPVTIIEFLDYQ